MLFKTEAALRLIQRSVPLLADLTDREAVGSLFEPKRTARGAVEATKFQYGIRNLEAASTSQQQQQQSQIWQREFTSWKALRQLISEAVLHRAVRDMLNTYEPFDDTEASEKAAPTDRLEREHISIQDVTVSTVIC